MASRHTTFGWCGTGGWGYILEMPKDRDQLTPEEPGDRAEIHPHRSAAKEAVEDFAPAGDEHGKSMGDPKAAAEVPTPEKGNYK
jgi:hypothetical protein